MTPFTKRVITIILSIPSGSIMTSGSTVGCTHSALYLPEVQAAEAQGRQCQRNDLAHRRRIQLTAEAFLDYP